MATDMTVPNEILRQLGGNRFKVMTGATNFVGDERGLRFRLPSAKSKSGKRVNVFEIRLDPSDTYTLSSILLRNHNFTPVETISDVYVDNLQQTFRTMTGLDTHL
jgi:hypothetical protein